MVIRAQRLARTIVVAALSVGCASSGHTERRVVVEQTPDGPRTAVVTTEWVEAPPPPSRPADPLPDDPLVRFNLDLLNEYRAKVGAPPLLYDAKISAFAVEGSRQLARDHKAHAHFRAHAEGAPGFGSRSAENQGDPDGVPPLAAESVGSGRKQITMLLKLMFEEGPGGGHYDNMVNRHYKRVGLGVYRPGGTLYLTNDFSD